MTDNGAAHFIRSFEEKAEAIKSEVDRSKKYRAGIAALAQKSVDSGNMAYLDAALTFTDRIIDEHDRSKAYVDIVRGTARVARNTEDPGLLARALEISGSTGAGLDRSHALQGVAAAMADIGAKTDDIRAIKEAEALAATIEYDTYRSMALRSIARSLHGAGDTSGANHAASEAYTIIDSPASKIKDIYRASAYIDLSRLFLDLGLIQESSQFIYKAAEYGSRVTDEFERSSIFQSIAQAQAVMGARTKEKILLKEAVRSFDQITREYYRTYTRRILVKILNNLGEKELIKLINEL